ncbi:MAG TPA: hypothetical protein IAC33_03555 [Candidatus Fimousia stercorigallinarum]|nr:hypothetical protein [Candidatus Fimousia stercorigallinarum]
MVFCICKGRFGFAEELENGISHLFESNTRSLGGSVLYYAQSVYRTEVWDCGNHMDRVINATINIREEGKMKGE